MSYNSTKEVFNILKKNLKKGIIIQMDPEKPKENETKNIIKKNKNNIMKCDFDECDNQLFVYGDEIIIFKECKHHFHKECIQNIQYFYKNDNSKYYIENNFCPKCFDII